MTTVILSVLSKARKNSRELTGIATNAGMGSTDEMRPSNITRHTSETHKPPFRYKFHRSVLTGVNAQVICNHESAGLVIR